MRINRLLVPSMAVLGPPQLQGQDLSHHSLFTFGDSYTSTRFNASGTQPSLDDPMGNPNLGQGTTSGGINWVGYLTTVYNDTTVLNFNMANYGATVDNSIVDGKLPDLVDQVSHHFRNQYCSALFESSPGWRSDTALFAIWIGINDVQISFMRTDTARTISRILHRYFHLLHQLRECGARHFLLLNVPPTTRTPQMLCYRAWEREVHREAVLEFNYQLQEAVWGWRRAHRDSTIALYDAWSFMTELLDHPRDYGFEDSSCMGPGCIWWDDYHPTSAFHSLLAADVAVHLHRTYLGLI